MSTTEPPDRATSTANAPTRASAVARRPQAPRHTSSWSSSCVGSASSRSTGPSSSAAGHRDHRPARRVVPARAGNFLENATPSSRRLPFWQALVQQRHRQSTVAALVVFFSTLAGFAFAKLRFRGRNGLLVFVVATMAVPTQLGVVPLFIIMAKLGWIGSLWRVILPCAGQRVRRLLDDPVPAARPARRADRGRPRGRRVARSARSGPSPCPPPAPPRRCWACSPSSRRGPTSSGRSSCSTAGTRRCPSPCSSCSRPTSSTTRSSCGSCCWPRSPSSPVRRRRASSSSAASWQGAVKG